MGEHFKEVCEYGYLHSQCRCMAPHKQIRYIECNNSNHASNPLNQNSRPQEQQVPKTTDVPVTIDFGGLNGLRDRIHATAKEKGWWEDERDLGTILMLCVTELAEALEEYRNGHSPTEVYYRHKHPITGEEIITDTYISVFPKYTREESYIAEPLKSYGKPEGVPVELADCIIRILDFCGYTGIDIQDVLHQKLDYNDTRSYKHGGKIV